MNEHPLSSAMIISSLGWLASVVVVAVVLFGLKPYVVNMGYEQGRTTQAAANIIAVDVILADRTIEGSSYVVLGRVISKTNTSVVIETLNPYLVNPLRTEPRHQTVLVDASTVIEKRIQLSGEEFMKAQEEGRRNGLSTQDIIVHKTETLTLADLKIGEEIRVYPKTVPDAVKDEFFAKQILLVISSQQPSSN